MLCGVVLIPSKYIHNRRGTIWKIPWYRDFKLFKYEIIVAKECLLCHELISTNCSVKLRHDECQAEHRRRRAREYNPPKKDAKPKYCEECGSLLRRSKWVMDACTRCDVCQLKHQRRCSLNAYDCVVVGMTCSVCGKFFLYSGVGKYRIYCDDCVPRKDVRKSNQANRESNKPFAIPKYCENCGNLLYENAWNRKSIKLCTLCQAEKRRIRNIEDHYYPVTVLATCVKCGKLFETHSASAYYCPDCREHRVIKKNKPTKADDNTKTEQIKKYRKNLIRKPNIEKLGTLDTTIAHGYIPITNVKVKDFDKEEEFVKHLKLKTLRKKKRMYSQTEGDWLRCADSYKEGEERD